MELWDGDFEDPKEVMINMEWGAFGENGALDFIRTEFDRSADSRSIKPGAQMYALLRSIMHQFFTGPFLSQIRENDFWNVFG